MEKEFSERFDHLENLIETLTIATAKGFDDVEKRLTKKIDTVEENLVGKIHGLQRGLDSQFERVSGIDARVSKIEEELHA